MATTATSRIASLDGLRAVAVTLVIAFHADHRFTPGGFVGVDVFFVLSGFVITRHLLETSVTGLAEALRFWAGRAARLVPAAVIASLGGLALYAIFATPVERAAVGPDAVAALLYVANWHFIAESSEYFRDAVDSSPMLHMWSLSVEEQFYLVWPLILMVVRRVRAVSTPTLLTTVAVAAIGWHLVASQAFELDRVYYGTDTRAYQLLIGAAAAAWLSARDGRSRRSVALDRPRARSFAATGTALTAIVGAGAMLASAAVPGWDPIHRGWLASVGAILVIVPCSLGSGAFVGRALSVRPIVGIGTVSYGMYLWHWPLAVVLERVIDVGDTVMTTLVFAACFTIAFTSHSLIEEPIQRWTRSLDHGAALRVAAALVTVAVVAAFVAVPAATSSRLPQAQVTRATDEQPPTLLTRTPVPPDLGWRAPDPFPADGACVNTSLTRDDSCRVVDGPGPRVVLLGDSHAGDLMPVIGLVAEHSGSSLHAVVTAGCPWQPNLASIAFDSPTCRDVHAAIRQGWIDAIDPDLVIVVSHPAFESEFELTERDGGGTPLDEDRLQAATRRALEWIMRADRRVVVIEPRPSSPFHSPNCLSGSEYIEQCAFIASPASLAETVLIRQLAAEDPASSLRTLDLNDLICPRYPTCDAIVKDLRVRFDRDHLEPAFAQSMLQPLIDRLDLANLAPNTDR